MKAVWIAEDMHVLVKILQSSITHCTTLVDELLAKMQEDNLVHSKLPWYKKFTSSSKHTMTCSATIKMTREDWNLHFVKVEINNLRALLDEVMYCRVHSASSIEFTKDEIRLIMGYSKEII